MFNSEGEYALIYPKEKNQRDPDDIYAEYCSALDRVTSLQEQIKVVGDLHPNKNVLERLDKDLEIAKKVFDEISIEYRALQNSLEQDDQVVYIAESIHGRHSLN